MRSGHSTSACDCRCPRLPEYDFRVRCLIPSAIVSTLPDVRVVIRSGDADVAQWQSTAFVKPGLWVRLPPSACFIDRASAPLSPIAGRTKRRSPFRRRHGLTASPTRQTFAGVIVRAWYRGCHDCVARSHDEHFQKNFFALLYTRPKLAIHLAHASG